MQILSRDHIVWLVFHEGCSTIVCRTGGMCPRGRFSGEVIVV